MLFFFTSPSLVVHHPSIANTNVSHTMAASGNEVGLITYPAIVNIATLVVFFVYLIISIWLIFRQGLGRSSPWIWLTLLAICGKF